ncbi:hypothetical protein Scep_014861 [Stephania cephalantha]|uniref:Uncharacterized protein n=1 Tax=Stephania cephalantha TaxID=152367 RepID=A0AAP0J3H4_9MAGN
MRGTKNFKGAPLLCLLSTASLQSTDRDSKNKIQIAGRDPRGQSRAEQLGESREGRAGREGERAEQLCEIREGRAGQSWAVTREAERGRQRGARRERGGREAREGEAERGRQRECEAREGEAESETRRGKKT